MSKISTGHARKLVQNYKRMKIGKPIKVEETRGVWFPKDLIETALYTKVNGIEPTGLRFYFAAYEKRSGTNPPKHDFEQERITLVIVPTKAVNNAGAQVPHPYRTGELIHFDLLTGPHEEPKYDVPKIQLEENDGQICPPPPPPAAEELGLDNGL